MPAQPRSRNRALEALVEATRVVAAAGSLDQALDALAEQARALLDADDVMISLVGPGTDQLTRVRPSSLAAASTPFAATGTPVEPNAFLLEGEGSGRPVF